MTAKPHEDPNCKCKACEEWAQSTVEDLTFLRTPEGYEAHLVVSHPSYTFAVTWDDGAKGQ